MNRISKKSKILLYISTVLWCAIMLTVCALMHFRINVSEYFSFNILLEFTKAISLWYIIAIGCSFITDIILKKQK